MNLAQPYTDTLHLFSVGSRMVHVIVAAIVVGILCLLVYRCSRPIKRAFQWLVATVLLFGSLALAVVLGTVTELILPGICGIMLGGATGALLGWLTWLFTGTLGIATGGTAFALGGAALAVIFALVGTIVGTTTGFGLRTIHQWVIAIPILILALALIARNRKRVESTTVALPPQER